MKVKTSVTLSEDLVAMMDERSHDFKNRSDLVETAVRAFLGHLARQEQDARDLEIIRREADRINEEAADVLDYQVIP